MPDFRAMEGFSPLTHVVFGFERINPETLDALENRFREESNPANWPRLESTRNHVVEDKAFGWGKILVDNAAPPGRVNVQGYGYAFETFSSRERGQRLGQMLDDIAGFVRGVFKDAPFFELRVPDNQSFLQAPAIELFQGVKNRFLTEEDRDNSRLSITHGLNGGAMILQAPVTREPHRPRGLPLPYKAGAAPPSAHPAADLF